MLVLLTPFQVERYVLPVVPLLYAYTAWGLWRWWDGGWLVGRRRWIAVLVSVSLLGGVVVSSLTEVGWRLRTYRQTLHLPGQTTPINWEHFLERRLWTLRPDELLAMNDFMELHLWVRDNDPSDAIILSLHPRLSGWISGHPSLRFPLLKGEEHLLQRIPITGARYVITTETNLAMPLYARPPVADFLSRCQLLQRRPFASLYRINP